MFWRADHVHDQGPYRDSNNIEVMARHGRALLDAVKANIAAQKLSFERSVTVEVVDHTDRIVASFKDGWRLRTGLEDWT